MDDHKGFFDSRAYIEAIRDKDTSKIMEYIRDGYVLEDMIIFSSLLPIVIPDSDKREDCLRYYKRCVKMHAYANKNL